MTTTRLASSTAAALALLLGLAACGGNDPQDEGSIPGPTLEGENDDVGSADEQDSDTSAAGDSDEGEDTESEEAELPEWPASNTTTMVHETTITDPVISPKSVVSNDRGLAIANNMMYQHTITVYDTEERELLHELDDTVNPADYGVEGYPEAVTGAPVEVVWTEDGEYAYVTNYVLTGLDGAFADDDCSNGEAIEPSAVYRYSTAEGDWDQFIEVGRVPKYVELTPDGNTLLVSNWCDHDMSVVDVASGEEQMRIPLNSQPRGIAVMPDNTTAYVTAMYANEVYKVDLDSGDSEVILTTGERPRHLVLDETGENLYITVAGANELIRFDPSTDEVVDRVATGAEPRTMDISADGTALYVVNYNENTVSKFDAETLEEIERLPSQGGHPIGVSYDAHTGTVWVANYDGSIAVYDDHSTER
ncbi:YncE family protein [Nesterenkonia alba]|uniref:YncE family protein n=1 Tax=Nesterenkonia alba TaxID=515814 RepID=UPI0003B39E87|nr:beta-propeller fold lactonase family protein [Nesterenkonia alba]